MNPFSLLLFLVLASFLWTVERKWALAPFLAGCCLMTAGQGIDLGPISLPMYRMLLLVGFFRAIVRKEGLDGPFNTLDKLMCCWAGWYLLASFFHDPDLGSGPTYVSGQIFNQLGFYFLVRIWCRDLDDMVGIISVLALILVPIAAEMMQEKLTGKNLFSFFGRVPENVLIREGKLRAQGPFLHPILAGTVGATCIPLFVGILNINRKRAMIGIAAGMFMVFASASSGPVMSLMAAVGALLIWRIRGITRFLRAGFVLSYLFLMMVMEQPPYYLISRIDLSGGSTGWHRSFLIDQTLKFFSEWWLFGTDHTRHWMPYQGVAMSPTHTDITNYYIGFAVGGGLLAMLLIITVFVKGLGWVGKTMDELLERRPDHAFMIWCFGSALFSHMVTGISVAYFDQSSVFVWLTVAVISSMYSATVLSEDYGRELDEETEEEEYDSRRRRDRWTPEGDAVNTQEI
jgi:hypothetical protein